MKTLGFILLQIYMAALVCLLAVPIFHGDGYFAELPKFTIYVAVPAALLALAIRAVARHPSRMSALTALMLSSTCGLLIGLEAWLAYDNYATRRAFSEAGDRRDADTMLAALKAEGLDPVPFVDLRLLLKEADDGGLRSVLQIDGAEILPLSGPAGRHVLFCRDYGYWSHFKTDSRGFRNPRDPWARGSADVVLLGDSYVQGHCVPESETIAAAIRRSLPSTVNLGYAGAGPLMELGVLMEYALALRPKLIVWFFFENDLEGLEFEKRSGRLRAYLDGNDTQNLNARFATVDQALVAHLDSAKAIGELHPSRARLALAKLIDVATLSNAAPFLGVPPRKSDWDYALFGRILGQAKAASARAGARLLVVYLPFAKSLTGLGRHVYRGGAARNRVLAEIRARKLPLLDFIDVLDASGGPLEIAHTPGGHYNANGYRLVGEAVAESARSLLGDATP